jgi:hypothetical protein
VSLFQTVDVERRRFGRVWVLCRPLLIYRRGVGGAQVATLALKSDVFVAMALPFRPGLGPARVLSGCRIVFNLDTNASRVIFFIVVTKF